QHLQHTGARALDRRLVRLRRDRGQAVDGAQPQVPGMGAAARRRHALRRARDALGDLGSLVLHERPLRLLTVRAAGRFAVAVVAVTLVACGSSSPARLSRPQFTAQVNAMCARFDTEIKRALGADYTPPTPATFDRILDSASKAISKTEDL